MESPSRRRFGVGSKSSPKARPAPSPLDAITEAVGPDGRFRPYPFLPGGHLQTVGGLVLRSVLRWPFPTEDYVVEAGDDVRLLVRASFQPADRPALLLVHGLEGSDRSSYLLATGALAYRAGWHVIRMNLRGCGDSIDLCPRLYNAGLTSDLVAVIRWLSTRASRIVVGGFSLGAGLSLLTVARELDALPEELFGVVAVSPPLDMSRSADALQRKSNWIYQRRFLRSLRRSYRERQRRLPALYELGRERGLRTLREFDDAVTAFYDGYGSAEDYYRGVSAGPELENIRLPALVLVSSDDPFIPADGAFDWPRSDWVRLEMTRRGGHVGFAGRSRAPGHFWAAERVLSFSERIASVSFEG